MLTSVQVGAKVFHLFKPEEHPDLWMIEDDLGNLVSASTSYAWAASDLKRLAANERAMKESQHDYGLYAALDIQQA